MSTEMRQAYRAILERIQYWRAAQKLQPKAEEAPPHRGQEEPPPAKRERARGKRKKR